MTATIAAQMRRRHYTIHHTSAYFPHRLGHRRRLVSISPPSQHSIGVARMQHSHFPQKRGTSEFCWRVKRKSSTQSPSLFSNATHFPCRVIAAATTIRGLPAETPQTYTPHTSYEHSSCPLAPILLVKSMELLGRYHYFPFNTSITSSQTTAFRPTPPPPKTQTHLRNLLRLLIHHSINPIE